MRIMVWVFSLYFLFGCAGIHKDIEAQDMTSDGQKGLLKVSAEVNNALSSEYFGMVEFTIENRTDQWMNIERFEVDAGQAQNRRMVFTLGRDFDIWSSAIVARNRVESFNRASAYNAILVSAALVSETDEPPSVSDGANIVGGTVLTSMSVEQIGQVRDRAEATPIFPENNILNEHIRIPPGLFVTAWLLINTNHHENNPPITELFLKAKYEDGRSDTFKIPLFSRYEDLGKYKWQSISQKFMKEEFSGEKLRKISTAGHGG